MMYFDELGFYHYHDYQSNARCWCGWSMEGYEKVKKIVFDVICGLPISGPYWHGLEYFGPDECEWIGTVEAYGIEDAYGFVCPACGQTLNDDIHFWSRREELWW